MGSSQTHFADGSHEGPKPALDQRRIPGAIATAMRRFLEVLGLVASLSRYAMSAQSQAEVARPLYGIAVSAVLILRQFPFEGFGDTVPVLLFMGVFTMSFWKALMFALRRDFAVHREWMIRGLR